MSDCNGGSHGALFHNYRGEWSCLLCNEIVNYNLLIEKRKKVEEDKKKIKNAFILLCNPDIAFEAFKNHLALLKKGTTQI